MGVKKFNKIILKFICKNKSGKIANTILKKSNHAAWVYLVVQEKFQNVLTCLKQITKC